MKENRNIGRKNSPTIAERILAQLEPPFSYIIREVAQPDENGTYPDFISKSIAYAPLSGEFSLVDTLQVFNMLISFTTDLPSSDWIKPTLRHNDGRRSMQALQNHFSGEGNASRNIAEADRLKASLTTRVKGL